MQMRDVAEVAADRRNRRPSTLAGLLLVPLILVSLFHGALPPVRGAGAPAAEFSAERALQHIAAVAKEPHPPGTAAHTAVREYLLAQFRAAGLEPQVQESVVPIGRAEPTAAFATVRNVMARLPGRAGVGGKALVLSAHYDSVPTGPGANDDGAGVATLLETLRALKAGPPLQQDVIFLITDGEEMGLLGAQAWVSEHPWAKDAGLFLNFEMRGAGGPAFLFEVNEGNGALMRELARAVPYPWSTSLAADVYRRMPNDTDVSVFRRLPGVAYLNVAAIEKGEWYHSSLDRLANVDQRTVQHMGEYALGVARHFGNQALPPARSADGAVPLVLEVVATANLAIARWGGEGFAQRPDLQARFYFSLGALCLLGVYGLWLWRRWAGAADLMLGALLWWGVAAVASAAWLPGGSYLFVWPVLFAGAGFAYWHTDGGWRGHVGLTLSLVPALVLGVSTVGMLFDALGWLPAVGTALLVLVVGLCAVQISATWEQRGMWVTVAIGLLALLQSGWALVSPPAPTAAYPAYDSLTYAVDAGTGKAWWLARKQDAWTRPYVGQVEWQDEARDVFPLGGYYYRSPAPAPAPLALPGPAVTVLSDDARGGERVLRVQVAPGREAALLGLYATGEVLSARVGGRDLPGAAVSPWSFQWVAPPAGGYTVEFRLKPGHPFRLRATEIAPGLPASVGRRPSQLQPGWPNVDWLVPPDSTFVTREVSL